MKATDLIDAVMQAGLAGSLKGDGFKKSSRTFLRVRGAVMHVLNVQASQWSSGGEGRFTLNLGVYAPELARVLGEPVHEKPKEYQCHARKRIGALMRTGSDQWWDVSKDTDIDALGAEIDARYRDLARPWLEGLSSLHALETSAECSGGDLARAGLALADGRHEEARRYLAPIFASAEGYGVGYVAQVRQFAQRHGLVDPG